MLHIAEERITCCSSRRRAGRRLRSPCARTRSAMDPAHSGEAGGAARDPHHHVVHGRPSHHARPGVAGGHLVPDRAGRDPRRGLDRRAAIHAIKLMPRGELLIAGVFGLVHGTAFATTILDLNLGFGEKLVAIVGFNIGVELAQLCAAVLVLPLLIWPSHARLPGLPHRDRGSGDRRRFGVDHRHQRGRHHHPAARLRRHRPVVLGLVPQPGRRRGCSGTSPVPVRAKAERMPRPRAGGPRGCSDRRRRARDVPPNAHPFSGGSDAEPRSRGPCVRLPCVSPNKDPR